VVKKPAPGLEFRDFKCIKSFPWDNPGGGWHILNTFSAITFILIFLQAFSIHLPLKLVFSQNCFIQGSVFTYLLTNRWCQYKHSILLSHVYGTFAINIGKLS